MQRFGRWLLVAIAFSTTIGLIASCGVKGPPLPPETKSELRPTAIPTPTPQPAKARSTGSGQ